MYTWQSEIKLHAVIYSPLRNFISITFIERIRQIYGSSLTIYSAYNEILTNLILLSN